MAYLRSRSGFFLLTAALVCLFLTVTASAQEAARSLTGAEIRLSAEAYDYNGGPHTPAVAVSLNGQRLVQGQDFTVAYRNNQAAGSAAVVVSGTGSYGGRIEKTFTIRPKALTAGDFSLAAPCVKTYDGNTSVTLALRAALLPGDEAAVSYDSAAFDDVFELLAWNQGIGYFSSEIGPSPLFQAYKMIKNMEKKGAERSVICEALKEKFGEKNPDVKV